MLESSSVILECTANCKIQCKDMKAEKEVLVWTLVMRLLLSKAPLKFKECGYGGYWLHKNAWNVVRKAHLALPSQFESLEWREKWGHFMDLWFLWYAYYSISIFNFFLESCSRQLNDQSEFSKVKETKLETIALLTSKSDYQLDFALDITFAHPKIQ